MQISLFLSAATPAHTHTFASNTGQGRAGQCGVRNVLQHQSEQQQQQQEQYVLEAVVVTRSLIKREETLAL